MSIMPLKQYCENEGIKPDVIQKRIREGVWRVGREVIRLEGFKNSFINMDAVEEYVLDPRHHKK